MIGVGLALAMVSSAAAGLPVTLKPEVSDADGLVTMSDLFEGAGQAGVIAVARRSGASVVLDAGAVQMAARRVGLDWANAQGIRRIIVRGAASAAAAQPGNVSVLTYARDFAAGEIVRPEDVVWTKLAARPAGAPRDAEAVIGMAARRPLREGTPVHTRDVAAPQVIKAGDLISVTWSDGAVSVTLQGKALQSAAAGEAFGVQNTASKKTLQAVASGPGQAVVGPAAQQLQSPIRAAQYASR
ncbi:MAG: flagellar basal body P-ring formation protein FlgA [Caulobacteraceae bacterium]|nr:flagellar basal body P-ring formation protein FlgA [Caulobacteraceae bacterium]